MSTPYKRPSSEVSCAWCKSMFLKDNREIRSAAKGGTKNFCSHRCSGKAADLKRNGPNRLIGRYVAGSKKRAKVKGIEFDLTEEYLVEIFTGRCAVTGVKIHLRDIHELNYTKQLDHASLDRIDNERGYVVGNVQFTALGINYMRNTVTMEDLTAFLEKLGIDK